MVVNNPIISSCLADVDRLFKMRSFVRISSCFAATSLVALADAEIKLIIFSITSLAFLLNYM